MTASDCRFYTVNGHQVYGVPAPENFAARPLTRRALRDLNREMDLASKIAWSLLGIASGLVAAGAVMLGVLVALVGVL